MLVLNKKLNPICLNHISNALIFNRQLSSNFTNTTELSKISTFPKLESRKWPFACSRPYIYKVRDF